MRSRDRIRKLLEEHTDYISGEKMAEELHISRNAVWKAIQALKKEGLKIDAVTNRGYRLEQDPCGVGRDLDGAPPSDIGKKELSCEKERNFARRKHKDRTPFRENNDGRTPVRENDKGHMTGRQKPSVKPGDILTYDGICRWLDPSVDRSRIHVFEEVESTNKTAKEMAVAGAPHGTVVIAGRQTGGQAHHARPFYSPKGGIYLSLVLHPCCFQKTETALFSETTAVAVRQAVLDVCGIKTWIRNRNDLYAGGKKVCGILNEAGSDLENADIQWIVAGIGIHFSERADTFPEELRAKAGSLYPDGQAPVSINRLAAEVINTFLLEKYGDADTVRNMWMQHHR